MWRDFNAEIRNQGGVKPNSGFEFIIFMNFEKNLLNTLKGTVLGVENQNFEY